MLKVLNLDFDIVSNIQKLQNDNIPIVVINHERDTLIPYPAQLAKAVDDLLLNRNSIKIVNLRGFTDNPHNGVLSSWQLSENLADLMPNKIMNR